MKANTADKLSIKHIVNSKITSVDFNNLDFGKTFTDYMFECDYVDGQWKNPTIKPYGPMIIDPSARVFHYGQAVFEGMKAFKDDHGEVWLFRPEQNFERINLSSKRLAIPEFPKEFFFEGLTTLLKLDKDWIKPGFGNALYIRPFVIATEPAIAASPAEQYKFMIICSPAKAYYTGEIRVLFAEKYSRSAHGGVGFAKAAGNYGAQFYPTNLANQAGFQQIIWTDAIQHEYLEEAGTMNIFFRVGDKLLTAPTNDRILDGITRKSILQIAQDIGVSCEVRPVSVTEIKAAAQEGKLKEMFGTGTAAVISTISAFKHADDLYELPELENSYASKLKNTLLNIQYNVSPDPHGWRYKI
ncbi:MAG: branched-chain amino acid aminotransferase [Flavobacteriaceae bacterium]|nr:branched-chain amino acid aminotransferase [Flavobacteriaceae bacterium]